MERAKYIDIARGDAGFIDYGWDIVQPKYDGMYCTAVICGGSATLYNRTGGNIGDMPAPGLPDCILAGELIKGTQRAKNSALHGCFVAFDADMAGDYAARLGWMQNNISGGLWRVVESYPISAAAAVWRDYVASRGFEGVVYRRSCDTASGAVIGREKTLYTIDAVIVAIDTSKARPAIICDCNGASVRVTSGLYADLIPGIAPGMVAEIAGNDITAAGKVRHPVFIQLRPDKSGVLS